VLLGEEALIFGGIDTKNTTQTAKEDPKATIERT